VGKNVLPKIGDPFPANAKTVATEDSVAVVLTHRELEPDNWTLSVPVLLWDEGYAKRRVDALLNESQAKKLKAIQLGLESKDAQLSDGRYVSGPVDAVRWMLENIA
jgi:hypothetical protein